MGERERERESGEVVVQHQLNERGRKGRRDRRGERSLRMKEIEKRKLEIEKRKIVRERTSSFVILLSC